MALPEAPTLRPSTPVRTGPGTPLQRRPGPLLRDDEFRLYAALLFAAALGTTAILAGDDLFSGEEAVRHAAFQVVTTMTTTGYASTNFAAWPFLALVGLVLLFPTGAPESTKLAIFFFIMACGQSVPHSIRSGAVSISVRATSSTSS